MARPLWLARGAAMSRIPVSLGLAMSRILLFLCLALPLGFSLALVFTGLGGLSRQRDFWEGAEVVQGTVVELKRMTTWSVHRPDEVTYVFTTPDGREHRGSDVVSRERRRRLRAGGPVTVQYLVGDPATSQVLEQLEAVFDGISIMVGVSVVVAVLPAAARWFARGRAAGTEAGQAGAVGGADR